MDVVGDVRSDNRRLSELEYKNGVTSLASKPRALFVELTRRCNLHCPMCRSAGSANVGETMSEALFMRIADELFATAEIVDLRGWGESVILPEFLNRAEVAVRYGTEIRVVTNLSYKRDSILDWLADHRAYVGVSLDGATTTRLDMLRPGSSLEMIKTNLHRLSTAYRCQNSLDRLTVYVTCQRPNITELPEILELIASTGITRVSLNPISIHPDHQLSLVGIDTKPVLDAASAEIKRLGLHVSLTASLSDLPEDSTSGPACLHPWTYVHFAFDGRVGFCDHLIGPAADSYFLGSLANSSFSDIWNGLDWIRLRTEHVGKRRSQAPFFHECAWCYRNRYTDFEDLLDPGAADLRRIL